MHDVRGMIEAGKSPFEQMVVTAEEFAPLTRGRHEKILVYSAGDRCEETIGELFGQRILPAFATFSDPAQWGKNICQIPVLSPEDAVNAIGEGCVALVAIQHIATLYDEITVRLESAGCREIYILNQKMRPRRLDPARVAQARNDQNLIAGAMDAFADETSRRRYFEHISAFLTSRLIKMGTPGMYPSKDGGLLDNDVFRAGAQDILVHCRSGFKGNCGGYYEALERMRGAHLFEPSTAGRTKTKEYFYGRGAREVYVYPYILCEAPGAAAFTEPLFFTDFLDQEDAKEACADGVPLDRLEDIAPTILYLDMHSGWEQALRGAARTIEKHRPLVILNGFAHPGDAAALMSAFPGWHYSMRYFGGSNPHENYALLART